MIVSFGETRIKGKSHEIECDNGCNCERLLELTNNFFCSFLLCQIYVSFNLLYFIYPNVFKCLMKSNFLDFFSYVPGVTRIRLTQQIIRHIYKYSVFNSNSIRFTPSCLSHDINHLTRATY